MTPTKETLEATNSVSDAASHADTKAKPDAARLRADAVSLEVPVKVHGSRVKEVVMGTTPHTEPFEEQTTTMIVFPQGGVLKMSTTVGAGQMMVVTNLKSGHDAICRVVKVRAYGQGQSYVEIEFTHRQAGYWGVYFPTDGPDPASQTSASPAASVAPAISVDVKVEKAEEKSVHETPAMPPALKPPAPKPASKPDSAFAQIGSQEDVQPAAASTSTRVRPSPLVEAELNRGRDAATKTPAIDSPRVSTHSPSSSAPSLSLNELQGDSRASSSLSFAGAGVPGEVADEVEEETAETPHAQAAESSAPAFGRLAATASLGSSHASTRESSFGSGLGSSSLSIGGHESATSTGKKTNWLAIAASAIATVAIGLGAAFYLHLPPFAAKSAKSTAPVVAPAAPPVETAAESNPTAQSANSTPVQTAQVNDPAPSSVAAAAPVVTHASQPVPSPKPSKPSAAAPAPGPAAATETSKSAAKVPDMFGALNAHPTSHARSDDAAQAAPSLDASAAPENIGGLPSLSSGPAAPAAAPVAGAPAPVEHRVRVGGQIKPPRLVSSALPEYPAMARNAGVEGDVVVDTTIDENGKVATMKVISGPVLLRQAALDALRRWKYEPSKLNGEPVQVQMTVTIKFHRE